MYSCVWGYSSATNAEAAGRSKLTSSTRRSLPVGEEVLERLRPLAVRAGGADAGVEREQAALQVAARRVVPGADAEVAADRALAADLVVGEVARAGGERGGVLLELEQRVDRASWRRS